MKHFFTLLVLGIILFSSCKKDSVNCGAVCSYEEELMFQTGFTGNTVSDHDKWGAVLGGVDDEFPILSDGKYSTPEVTLGKRV